MRPDPIDIDSMMRRRVRLTNRLRPVTISRATIQRWAWVALAGGLLLGGAIGGALVLVSGVWR